MYDSGLSDNGCYCCKHRRYDTNFDETWCGHKPPPDMLGPRFIVNDGGHCEHFERDTELYPLQPDKERDDG